MDATAELVKTATVGKPLPHDSAHLHVSGTAAYTDDLAEPRDLLHVAVGMSSMAHARIRNIGLDDVLAADGVVDVCLAEHIPGENNCGPIVHDEEILATNEVGFVGQAIFAVAATTVDQARKAARLASIDYEELEAILDPETAVAKKSFVLPSETLVRGDPGKAISTAPHRVRRRLSLGGQDQFYLEGHIAMAIPQEDNGLLVYSSTQHPDEVQHLVAEATGRAAKDVVCICRRMGGAFGGKESQAATIACIAALMATKTGRSCKLRLDRDDDMIMTGKRHDFVIDYDAGFDDTGRIMGIDFTFASRCGISADLSGPVNDRTMFHCDNAYFLENVRIESHRCKTNTVSNTAFRGFGGPQGMFAIEHVIDDIARQLNEDPLAVRRRNFYGVGERDVTQYGQTVEDNIIADLVDKLEADADYQSRREGIRKFNKANPILRRGIAMTPVKFGISFTATHLNQAGALVHVYKDGSVHLNHGGTEMGQGLFIKVAQVVADELGVGIDRIRNNASDTSKVPNASATAASSGSDMNGKAAQIAARKIRCRLTEFAARHFAVNERGRRFCRRFRKPKRQDPRLRRAGAACVVRSRIAVGNRFLQNAEDQLRPRHVQRSTVFLLRIRSGGQRSYRRYINRREPHPAGRYPARLRRLAEPGDGPRPGGRRFRAGRGLADVGGGLLERQRRIADARTIDLQNSHLLRPGAGLQGHAAQERRQSRGYYLPFEGRRRTTADVGDLGLPRDSRRHCH